LMAWLQFLQLEFTEEKIFLLWDNEETQGMRLLTAGAGQDHLP